MVAGLVVGGDDCAPLSAPGGAGKRRATIASVTLLMNYAWDALPEKFTPPNGKTIVVDKKKKRRSMVPLDMAREVGQVG